MEKACEGVVRADRVAAKVNGGVAEVSSREAEVEE